jgi:hypothetical protein
VSTAAPTRPPSLLELAIRYRLDRDWSMVPSAGAEKRPCGAWKLWQKERPTVDQMRQWDRMHRPERWGPVTGALSGIVVVDFDGEKGRAWLEQWGFSPHVQTGSGGFHVYFRHPGWKVPTLNAKTSKRAWPWPGVDIRGDGGFAVLLGSNQNGPYQVLREIEPESFDLLPAELREFLRAGTKSQGPVQPARPASGLQPSVKPDRVDAERLIQAALCEAPKGRNNAGMALAVQARDNGYSESDSWIIREYQRRCPPTNAKGQREPYTEAEALASWREAFSRPAREPWAKPRRSSAPPDVPIGEAPPEPPPPADKPPAPPEGLPLVFVNNRQLREVSEEALAALQKANDPPFLFARSGSIVAIHEKHVIAEVGESALRGWLTRTADYLRARSEGAPLQVAPPIDVVRDILALPPETWSFKPLDAVVEAPVLRPDGSILDRAGYDAETRLYYAPDPELRMPCLPERPTPQQLDWALEMVDQAIGEFPFVDTASRANAFAALLTPLVRPAINAPAPMALLDAPQPGTGKSLLADLVAIVATGRPGEMFSAPRDDDEWRKQITTALMSGSSVVVIDNVVRKLDNGDLCKVLTESLHADRAFRTHQKILLPVKSSFFATGNNIRLGGDMPRRCFWIRLDAKSSRPFLRTGFKIPDLKAWAVEHRGELLAALLMLARAWYLAGRPKSARSPLGSYEAWSMTIAGILEYVGVEGFLENATALYEESDSDEVQWAGFLQVLHEVFYGEPFTLADVVEKLRAKTSREGHLAESTTQAATLRAALPDYLAEAVDREGFFQRRAGKCFAERVGRRFGESQVHLLRDGLSHKVQQWKIGGLGG